MLRGISIGFCVVLVGVGAVAWWLLVASAEAPRAAPGVIDIATWRAELGEDNIAMFPSDIQLLEVGSAPFPRFAVQAGAFGPAVAMSFNALRLATPSGDIIIGGAIDAETARLMGIGADGFDEQAYAMLEASMAKAQGVLITHEHPDHIMALARSSHPGELAPRLWLNAAQTAALPQFAGEGGLAPPLGAVTPSLRGDLQRVAPGVLVVPAAGHTAGSQMIFVTLMNGQEYLLIGDIAWVMSNISDLRTRPILTQFAVFDPNEDREAVKAQLRALHDLQAAEPDVNIVPSHDQRYLQGLLATGVLTPWPVSGTPQSE